jgi:hypothetical protein
MERRANEPVNSSRRAGMWRTKGFGLNFKHAVCLAWTFSEGQFDEDEFAQGWAWQSDGFTDHDDQSRNHVRDGAAKQGVKRSK